MIEARGQISGEQASMVQVSGGPALGGRLLSGRDSCGRVLGGRGPGGLGVGGLGVGGLGVGGRALGLVMLAAAAAVCGCQSAPQPQDMARTNLGTAPADLQLMCASAAGGTAGVDSSKILPTGSRQLDASSYSVDLDAGGRKLACVIDSNGSVKSVGPVAGAATTTATDPAAAMAEG